jgi:hypothetical protein
VVGAVVALSFATVVAIPAAGAQTRLALQPFEIGASQDFDGDGYDDLVVPAPWTEPRGELHVLYGSARGPSAERDILIPRARGSYAVGDFDGDGFDDLALGLEDRWVNGQRGAGEVFVYDGSAAGLPMVPSSVWSQDSPGVNGVAQRLDLFGAAVRAVDLDVDGYSDLVVGAPGESVSLDFHGKRIAIPGSGAFHVLFGSAAGLSAARNQQWTEYLGIPGIWDQLGSRITGGDFNGDGYPELAVAMVGGPRWFPESLPGAGAVWVISGSPTGPVGDPFPIRWSQDSPGIAGVAEYDDEFGYAIASGDLNDDGRDDLVIGAPRESLGSTYSAGVVHVILGSAFGLTPAGSRMISQASPGVVGAPEEEDEFGAAVAVGDLDADGFDDVLVGTRWEGLGAATLAGVVHVFRGGPSGLMTMGGTMWSQNTPGIGGRAEFGDAFGMSLATADFDDDGYSDVAIGAPLESFSGQYRAGAVNVIRGAVGGLTPSGNQLWTEDSPSVLGVADDSELFGFWL